MKKNLLRLAQAALTIFFIYVTISKVDLKTLLSLLGNINFSYIIISILLYFLSQIVSSERLRLILNSNDYQITFYNNFILYLIGIFYNFFIPGGFGGDAYKFYLMKKNYEWDFKKLFKLLVFDRLIGLGALVCILFFMIQNFILELNLIYMIISLLFTLILGFYIVKYVFNNQHIYFKSLVISVINQFLQFLTIFFVILSLGIENNFVEIIIVFICSSILSVFSIGGIGIREYIFLISASFINVSPELSASVGLLFTFSASFSTLPGLGYLISKPKFLK